MGMNKAMRMLMLTDGRDDDMRRYDERDYDDMDMRMGGDRSGTRNYNIDVYTDGFEAEYEPGRYGREGKSRMRMGGRPRMDGGYYMEQPEMRRGRSSRTGRYVRMGGYDGNQMRMGGYAEPEMSMWPYPGMVPPVYREDGGRGGMRSAYDEYPRMNRIGFSGDVEMNPPMEVIPRYSADATYPEMHEVGYSKGSQPMMGGAKVKSGKMTKEMVDEWMEMLENSVDGSSGPHWNRDQVKALGDKMGIKYDKFTPDLFYALVNSQYADLGKVAKKMNVATPEFFGEAAKAWLCDDDFDGTPEEKAYLYFTEIIMH